MPAEFASPILLRLILGLYFVYISVYILPACVSLGHVQAMPRRSEEDVGSVTGVMDNC